MAAHSENQDLSESFGSLHMSGYAIENLDLPVGCMLCQRVLSFENEAQGDLEAMRICGDCKFLFLEDLGSPTQDPTRRRLSGGRRTTHTRSESAENLFSQQFSHIVSAMRQNDATISGRNNLSDTRLLTPTSSRTTPSGSRRWQRVLSDTESDGMDNLDTFYGEVDSNVSIGGYAVSFNAYGAESEVSIDDHSFLDIDMFIQQDDEFDLDSVTDIDPMRAGLNQWNSDDLEEEGVEDDDEWGIADTDYSVLESMGIRDRTQLFLPSPSDNSRVISWRGQFDSSENYISTPGFSVILEHLAETENSRRGAPPASLSFVDNIPRIVINKEHHKQDDLICVICKDFLSVNIEVIQLPCFHLYHPCCILPWLSARNSCPLCRYELPTDDQDYENAKRNYSNRMDTNVIDEENSNDDSSSAVNDTDEAHDPSANSSNRDIGRSGWFLNSAAPIVSFVGIALIMWLGKPVMDRRGLTNFSIRTQNQIHNTGSRLLNRTERRSRWWSLF